MYCSDCLSYCSLCSCLYQVCCHGKEQAEPTCAAETAWVGEVEVLSSFHCTKVTEVKNLNDLPSWTKPNKHISILVIFEIKMSTYVWDCGHSQMVLLPGGKFLCGLQSWFFLCCPLGFLVWHWHMYGEGIRMETEKHKGYMLCLNILLNKKLSPTAVML